MSLRATAVVLVLSAGCGRTELMEDAGTDGGLPTGCVPLGPAAADTELLRRWNVAVDLGPAATHDFHWRDVNDFPHPTYRGGSALAYAEFVDVLVRFWADGSTVAFVRCNALFDRAYKTGPVVATQKTVQLRPLTSQLSTDISVDAPHRAALVQACGTIGC